MIDRSERYMPSLFLSHALLNLVSSENAPQVNVQFHMVVVLKNIKCSEHIIKVA